MLALFYFSTLTYECLTVEKESVWLIMYGAFYSTLYLFTLALVVIANYAEYKFISDKFGSSRNSPARKVCYIGLIYILSFTARCAYTFFEMIDPAKLMHLQ